MEEIIVYQAAIVNILVFAAGAGFGSTTQFGETEKSYGNSKQSFLVGLGYCWTFYFLLFETIY